MTTALKLRRGTTSQHSTFTGADGEVTVDTTKKTVVVHDGATAGGKPLLTEANPSYTGTLTGGTGVINIGSGQFYKDASGNVGIGTTSAYGKLNVVGGTGTQTAAYFAATDADLTGCSIKLDPTNSTATLASEWNSGGTALAFGAGPSEAMRINTSLNIAMGTTDTNNARLTVDRGSSTATGLLVRGDVVGTSDGLVVTYSGAAVANFRVKAYMDSYNGAIDFRNGSNTTTARITASGNSYLNGGDLWVGGTGANTGLSIQPNAFGTGNLNVNMNHPSGVGGNSYIQFVYGTSSVIGSIVQNGTSAVSYNTSSDYRLKENIAPMQGALDTVAQLKPVTYKWKADGSSGQGFIAHELQAVVPDCVTGEKDATRIEQYEIEPARKVTVTKQRPVIEKVMVKQHSIDCVDGVYTACIHDVEVEQPVMEQKPVFNEDGTPHMVMSVPEQPEQLDEEGNVISPATPAQYVQATISVPVMEDYETEEEIPAVMGEREVPAYQGIDTSFLVGTLTAAIQELKALVDSQAVEIAALKASSN